MASQRGRTAALAGFCLVVALGACRPEPEAIGVRLGDDFSEGSDFRWTDDPGLKVDFDTDLGACQDEVLGDPWVMEQGLLNRSIILIGCMNKRGWTWLNGNIGGPPLGEAPAGSGGG